MINPRKLFRKRRNIFIGVSLILVLDIIFAIFFLTKLSVRTVEIELTDTGYSPDQVILKVGDRVTFKTNTGRDFWPASNIHPTHEIYPEFDAKTPISPNETWSFVFGKPGKWRFHDHLNEYAVGEITVLKDGEEVRFMNDLSSCSSLEDSDKSKCYEDVVYEILKNKGIYAALETVGQLFGDSGDPFRGCHGLMHEVGRRAYSLFKQDKDFEISDKTSYCGYGFYHGFMEEMLHTSGDIQEARDFCEYVDKKLQASKADAGGACYHGIGHGVVEDEPPPNLWGNTQGIIDQGLEYCDKVTDDEYNLRKCGSGIYNAYEILATSELYDLSHDENDFFAICHNQREIMRGECYQQLIVPLKSAVGDDFVKGMLYIDSRIEDDENANLAVISIMVERSHAFPDDYSGAISDCRIIPARLHLACIEAYAEGFLKYGPPEREYVKAIDFCSSIELNEEEKMACFQHVLSLLRVFYDVEKSSKICADVEKRFQYENCIYKE